MNLKYKFFFFLLKPIYLRLNARFFSLIQSLWLVVLGPTKGLDIHNQILIKTVPEIKLKNKPMQDQSCCCLVTIYECQPSLRISPIWKTMNMKFPNFLLLSRAKLSNKLRFSSNFSLVWIIEVSYIRSMCTISKGK